MARAGARPYQGRSRAGGRRRSGAPPRPSWLPGTRRAKATFHRYRRPRRGRGIRAGLSLIVPLFIVPLFLAWLLSHTGAGRERQATRPTAPQRVTHLAGPAASAAQAPLPMAGPPTLNAARVDAILAAYGSPLRGHGAALVALGAKYRVDVAVALAFFVMESRAGTQGEALRTHSFGNLRPLPGEPELDGYRAYRTWLESARDWFRVIRSLYLGTLHLRTVEAVVPVYAPSSDSNDPATMIAGIRQLVACWRGDAAICPDQPGAVRRLVATGSPA